MIATAEDHYATQNLVHVNHLNNKTHEKAIKKTHSKAASSPNRTAEIATRISRPGIYLLSNIQLRDMTRSKQEIQDAVSLVLAMHVFIAANNMSHLFGDALNTISAAVAEIHEKK